MTLARPLYCTHRPRHFEKMLRLLLLPLLLYLLPAHAEVVRLTNGEWPPYLSEDLDGYGKISQRVTAAFHAAGVDVKYGFFPWRRALQLAAGKQWDGSLVWRKTPERERRFYFSDPVFYCDYVFFHRRSQHFNWKTLADLRRYRIGTTLEYDYGDEFRREQKSGTLKTDTAPTDEQNLRKLLAGRIDLFPVTREVGEYLLATHFTPEQAQQLAIHPRPLLVQPMYLLLNRQDPHHLALIQKFNRGLQQLD